MTKTHHIAIVGSGTAGLATAAFLARDGHRVTIFERFDQQRPVGSGLMLQPTGLAVLDALGLGIEAATHGARIDRLHGMAQGRDVLNVHYAALGSGNAFGLGIHRAALFAILHRVAISAGVSIVTGRTVAATAMARRGRQITFTTGSSDGPFDLVVDAAGARSPLVSADPRPLDYGALWTSIEWRDATIPGATLSQRYHRASRMAGILPIGRLPDNEVPLAALFWSLRSDRVDAWRRDGLEAWKLDWLRLWPGTDAFLDQLTSVDQMTFAHYGHRTLRRPVEPGLIHLGDSWHSTSPQLGQGANMALLDAFALAVGMRSESTIDQALARVIDMREFHVNLYQVMSRALTPVYQSDSRMVPWIRDRLVGPLSRVPMVERLQAAMVSGLVGRPLARFGLQPLPDRLSDTANAG